MLNFGRADYPVLVILRRVLRDSRGGAMLSREPCMSRSDTIDAAYYRRSINYGRTWSTPEPRSTGERRPSGMWRCHPRACYLDPATGRFLEFWVEGVLPNDDPLEGMRQWNIFYRVDAGPALQVIHEGAAFDARHPLPGVYTGRNCVMLGDVASLPITLPDRTILLPAITSPLGRDGKLYNPTGGCTYTDALVLHGRWHGKRLAWRAAEPVTGDPLRSVRGMDEPTLARLDDGRILMLLQGSNGGTTALPGWRWVAHPEIPRSGPPSIISRRRLTAPARSKNSSPENLTQLHYNLLGKDSRDEEASAR